MINPLRHRFSLVCICILFAVVLTGGQQPEKSVARLKSEHNRLKAIIDDPATSAEIHEMTVRLLEKNKASMREAIQRSVSDLEAYAQKTADMLDADDRLVISEKIEAYRYDFAQLESSGAPNAKSGVVLQPLMIIDDSRMPTNNLFRNANTGVTSANLNPQPLPAPKASFPDSIPVKSSAATTRPQGQAAATYTLTVIKPASGNGKIISSPAGIICGDDTNVCSADFAAGTEVTLIATSSGRFKKWNAGTCSTGSKTSLCKVTLSANVTETAEFTPEEYNWGRVRGYFTSGILLSKDRDITSTERNNFSKPDIYLDFTLDSNWLKARKKDDRFNRFGGVNTYFSARLTSLPVSNAATIAVASASPSATPTGSPTPVPTPCNSAECSAFITSEKGAKLEVGAYMPIIIDRWKFNGKPHALFVAPLIKTGIQTITGDRRSATAEARRFGTDDIFNYQAGGVMFGHYELAKDSKNEAPELISFLSITRGKFENFEYLDPDGPKDSLGNLLHRIRPLRWEAVGLLKVPRTPFVIGFNGNFGKGPDDLRFLFGVKFDIAKVLNKLDAKP